MTDRSPPPDILLVEDTPSLSRLYVEYLRKAGHRVALVETGRAALSALESAAPRVMLLDLKLPDMDGMEVLRHVRRQNLATAVIVVTANGSVNAAVEAMREGAHDFIVKPFSADRLIVTVANAIEHHRLSRIVDSYRHALGRDRHHGFIGASHAMQAVYRIIDSAAASKATVFITGESGTGKEVAAEAIHRQSPRRDRPFIALNCGAIPKDLLESEIFGHVRGAFTGALADREGAAAQADGGTLFFDELCELDINLQTKLLRFLQTGSFTPVGSGQSRKVDIRVVCATNRDPLLEVEQGRFREDLYYRLHVIPLHLPPLREREGDLMQIAQGFLGEYAAEEGKRFDGFDPEAAAVMVRYDWPGNVRQLQNVIRNVVVLHDGPLVTRSMLPAPLNQEPAAVVPAPDRLPPVQPTDAPRILPLWKVERQAIETAIAACDGNIPRAAALLDVSPSTLYRKRLSWTEGTLGEPGGPANDTNSVPDSARV